MKTAATRPAAKIAAKQSSFFGKGGQRDFFSSASQKDPFFTKNGNTVQAKLTVNQPNDKYEKEADSIADKVVQRLSKPEPSFDETSSDVSGRDQSPITLKQNENPDRKDKQEDNIHLKEIQAKPIFEEDGADVNRKCDHCEKEEKEEKEKLQRKEDSKIESTEAGNEHLNTKAEDNFRTDGNKSNAAITETLPKSNGHTIQAKLTIGQPGDKYEKEADAVADNVIKGTGEIKNPNPPAPVSEPSSFNVQSKCAACEQEEKKQEVEEETVSEGPIKVSKMAEGDAPPEQIGRAHV